MIPTGLHIQLFGSLHLAVGGIPRPSLRSRKAQWLLSLLALRAGREVSREWLAATLWPDTPESNARRSLRQCLSDELRPALGEAASCLQAPAPATLRLDTRVVWVDVLAFDAAIEKGDPASLAEALGLYRGPLLVGCTAEWALQERTTRQEAFHTALQTLAAEAMTRHQPAQAASYLRRLIASDPLRESAHAALMEALAASGDAAGVRQVYRDLRVLLRRELNAEPAPATRALFERLQQPGHQPALPSRIDLHSPERRLPVPLTRLIGREEDIEAVTARFTQTRMLTLTGSGGVGKTRLAIAVAEAMAAEFADGVWFVELAALSDPAQVESVVAQSLGVREQAGQTMQQTLKQALASRSLLLVLDNCEHLLEACAHLARELLSGCAKLRVLATSRQALGLTGEWVYRVPSLQTPPPLKSLGSPPDKEGMTYLLEYEAVQLFVERAAARNTTWKLTGPQVLAAAAICRELDGIPLAIEMAAARARSLSVEEIRARLGDRFALLRAGDRSVLPRHQTLRATLDWSYQLLSEAEQVLLSRLSVFAGGWTLEAAEAVCKDPNDITTAIQRQSGGTEEAAGPSSSFILHPSSSVLDLLTSLVDQSLVQVEVREGGTRYWLLETIRQYAAEQLRERGEEEAIRERHLRCFLELATEREDSNMGDGKNIMQTEIDNLHAALKWGLQPKGKRGEVEPGEPSEIEMAVLQLAREFCWFWYFRGYSRGGWGYLREALRREEAAGPSRVRAEALASAGFLALSQRDYEAAEALLEQSMALFKALGDPHGMQWPLQDLGLLAYVRDDYGTARVLFEQKLAFCRGQGDRGGIIESLPLLGMVVRDQGDYAMARALLEEALEICRETGDKVAIANACVDLAHVALAEGDYEGARTLHEEAQSLRHDLGHFDIFALGLADVGYAAWLQQDYAGVKRVVREAMSLTADLEQSGYLTRWHAVCQLECLELLAGLAQSEGEAARSACLFGAAEGLRKRLDLACQYWWQRAQRRLLGALERLPKTKEVQSAREVGRAMSLEQAIAFAIADPEPEATSAPWYNGPG